MKLGVTITRVLDYGQPNWVEAQFTDAHGQIRTFHDKEPIFVDKDPDPAVDYPQPGFVRCEFISESKDADGREVLRINTATPDGVESTEGQTSFEVYRSQVHE